MEWIILIAPVIAPVATVYIVRRSGWRSVWAQLGAAGIAGAAMGSFIAAAASALATAVRPETAMLRGAGVGFLFGAGVGILYVAIVALWERLARSVD